MGVVLVDELVKASQRIDKYEEAFRTIYENVARDCPDPFLRHCILRTIEGVMPEGRLMGLLDDLGEKS